MEFLMTGWNWVIGNIPQVLQIVGFFAILATMTKNRTDDKIVGHILDAVNFLGANFGKAKNDPSKE